jgi:hypothetical protein
MSAAARRALHGDLAPLIPRALSAHRCLEAFTMTTARLRDPADGRGSQPGSEISIQSGSSHSPWRHARA